LFKGVHVTPLIFCSFK